MTVVVFETHATSEDNEAGIATGWLPGRLSAAGREQALALGERRRADGVAAVFSSDLARAAETAELAFAGSGIPRFLDWRLRECDYGELNGAPRPALDEQRLARVDEPWPGGESWSQAVARVERALDDLPDGRVVVIGHVATRWALEHRVLGRPVADLVAEAFVWRPGWEYSL
ncbi:MAG TPA: histidine phosphatase family protein [Gaiellaceae bacterium]|nr:histidine phosphatase family protein [Gaiellaceae bacterium]